MMNSKRLPVLITFVIVIAILGLGVFALTAKKHEVEERFDQYAEALSSENFEAAYAFCGPEYREMTRYEEFQAAHKQLSQEYGPLRQVVRDGSSYVLRAERPRQVGRVAAVLKYSGRDVRIACEFRKYDGRWLLFGCERR